MLKLVKFKPQKKKSLCQKFLVFKGKIHQILNIEGREGRVKGISSHFHTFCSLRVVFFFCSLGPVALIAKRIVALPKIFFPTSGFEIN